MARWMDRLDGILGRLLFRAVGLACAMAALICAYAVWWHIDHWNPDFSLVPTMMFAVAALAAGSCVPYCFSRQRSFGEALDAMEGGTGDVRRDGKPKG